VREAGTVGSQAVLIAIGIDWEGRRNVLGVELANRESASSWKAFLTALRDRGLHGVQVAISDDHAGLRRAIREVLPEATWQRCYVHFLRNALDYLPRKADDDCLMELRWLYDRPTWRKPGVTCPHGSGNGRRGTRSCAPGWRKTSRKPSVSTVFRASITRT
jgi:putative transposase